MPHDILTATYLRLRTRLLASAKSIIGDADQADDALQEAFYRLWGRRQSIISVPQAEGLVTVSVRNASIDILRHRQSNRSDTIESVADMAEPQADADERRQLLASVTSIINSVLSEREREILTLRDAYGHEYEEIALRFNLSEGNVRQILSRARKKVRQIYLSNSNSNPNNE